MQTVSLLIADEVQLVGGEVGPTYEVIISRTRYVSAQSEIKTRIVACGVSLANARDLGEWIGAPSHTIFNLSPRCAILPSYDAKQADSVFVAQGPSTWISIYKVSISHTTHH